MVSSTIKFRLAVAGSLVCVVGVALLYRFREEAAGKPPDAPEVTALPDMTPSPAALAAVAAALPTGAGSVSDGPGGASPPLVLPPRSEAAVEYRSPPMQLYPGPSLQTA